MSVITSSIHYFLPFFSFILLVFGLMRNRLRFVLAALIVAIVSIIIQYQLAGDELFGTYFDYSHAALYSLNFIVVIVSLLFIAKREKGFHKPYARYPVALFFSLIIIASLLITTNVWINAYFIQDKLPKTTIVTVGRFVKTEYCSNSYTLYKINRNKQVQYLCPNNYGLIAGIGQLDIIPEELMKQMVGSKPIQFDDTNKP
jgi:hypothetical protein